MTAIKEMYAEYFVIDVEDLPYDVFSQLDDPFPNCDCEVHFSEDFYSLEQTLDCVICNGEKLKVSHADAKTIMAILDEYRHDLQQEAAENGA